MKAMIFSDLITSKNAFVQLLLISIVICGFLAWGTGEVIVGTGWQWATMAPLMYLFSIFAYDEMNGWERFRMTLPLTKHQVAYGALHEHAHCFGGLDACGLADLVRIHRDHSGLGWFRHKCGVRGP